MTPDQIAASQLSASWLGAIASIVQALIIIPATIIALVTLLHTLRASRRAATLEIVLRHELDPYWRTARHRFRVRRDSQELDSLAKIKALSLEERSNLTDILEFYELVAIAADSGWLEDKVLKQYYGHRIQHDLATLDPFIKLLRSRPDNKDVYALTEALAERWRK